MLVFPSVIAAGLRVAGQYGERPLRVGGHTVGYYSTTIRSMACKSARNRKPLVCDLPIVIGLLGVVREPSSLTGRLFMKGTRR